MIADIMLDASVGRSPAARRAGVESLARGLMTEIGSLDRGLSLALRIGSLVEKLNRLHYLSRWEAGARGPKIFFARCPYAAIIRKHPELCQMDAWALGGQTNLKAEQLAKIDPMAGAPTQCVFVLR
jgi:predicted ArsR family transcriptional regulator